MAPTASVAGKKDTAGKEAIGTSVPPPELTTMRGTYMQQPQRGQMTRDDRHLLREEGAKWSPVLQYNQVPTGGQRASEKKNRLTVKKRKAVQPKREVKENSRRK